MDNSPLQSKRLIRASVVGVGLAIVGILAFIGLWMLLGNAGMADAPRLFTSMCVPPLVIALILGGYALLRRR